MLGDNICPRCGGDLVLRHGKYGDFYGCSNYPECRFIKKSK
ncbi:MAG: topoisomerase DNA-binding C4 zinc finger domain-containing protein [Clostridiales bacterium]|nr:topoisomerase DNA-binding C4 zinc finger domain-containing protein [Clostridiales bacterium]